VSATGTPDSTADALRDGLISSEEEDTRGGSANVADGLFALSRAIAVGLKYLGNGDAGTTMGAIEAHGKAVADAAERIAGALEGIAGALNRLAEAVEELPVGGPADGAEA